MGLRQVLRHPSILTPEAGKAVIARSFKSHEWVLEARRYGIVRAGVRQSSLFRFNVQRYTVDEMRFQVKNSPVTSAFATVLCGQ